MKATKVGRGRLAALAGAVTLAILLGGAASATAGPGNPFKPCYWKTSSCSSGTVLVFQTKNSGYYSTNGLSVKGVGGQSKALRIRRSGTFYGWWYGTGAIFSKGFGSYHTQQHWCGNTGSMAQSMWCDMWRTGV